MSGVNNCTCRRKLLFLQAGEKLFNRTVYIHGIASIITCKDSVVTWASNLALSSKALCLLHHLQLHPHSKSSCRSSTGRLSLKLADGLAGSSTGRLSSLCTTVDVLAGSSTGRLSSLCITVDVLAGSSTGRLSTLCITVDVLAGSSTGRLSSLCITVDVLAGSSTGRLSSLCITVDVLAGSSTGGL